MLVAMVTVMTEFVVVVADEQNGDSGVIFVTEDEKIKQ